jgi:hypothetical protein
MGKDVLDIVKDVTLNVATGGLYSLGTSLVDTVKTGNPSHLLTQGLDIGMAATGNNLAEHLGGDKAAMAFNAAGGVAGLAGGGLSALSPTGFGAAAEGVAPTVLPGATGVTGAAALTEGAPITATGTATELAPGVMSSTTPADLAGAELTGKVGAEAGITPLATPPPSGSGVLASSGNTGGLTSQDYGSLTGSVERIKQGADVAKEMAGWSPAVKSALALGGVLTAGQMATGALGGIFAGVSAQKRLQLEQLINQQNQNQRLYLNANNSFAPSLKFNQPAGVLATPKAA